ncbi:hypothetical protein, partial [Propionibacterium freudenreichii]|uniref:hypothetical protein n=1 Tax=Propionibacterium freudenreichii TaxID=1744 RepID=UPI0025505876
MSRPRSNMGLAGEQSSECLGGREIAQSAAGSIVDLLGDGGEVGLVIGDHRALGQILPVVGLPWFFGHLMWRGLVALGEGVVMSTGNEKTRRQRRKFTAQYR